jgi:hypothetical protein
MLARSYINNRVTSLRMERKLAVSISVRMILPIPSTKARGMAYTHTIPTEELLVLPPTGLSVLSVSTISILCSLTVFSSGETLPGFEEVCTVEVNPSNMRSILQKKKQKGRGFFEKSKSHWVLNYKIAFRFGSTELKAFVVWEENVRCTFGLSPSSPMLNVFFGHIRV